MRDIFQDKSMERYKIKHNYLSSLFNFDIFMSLISGPLIATLLMLIPLGVLIGLFEVIDPAFVAYEFIPEEILFIPWLFLCIIISVVNVRAAYLLSLLDISSALYLLPSDQFFTPPEDRIDLDEYPGRHLSTTFRSFILNEIPSLSCHMPKHKDYGWSMLFDNDINSVIEVSFALIGIDELNPHLEEYEVSIDYVVPLNPFFRISFNPNKEYFEQIIQQLELFMRSYGIEPNSLLQ